jgi:hypothetical protein
MPSECGTYELVSQNTSLPSFVEFLATETIITPTLNSEAGTYYISFYFKASNFPELDFSGSSFTATIEVLFLEVD